MTWRGAAPRVRALAALLALVAAFAYPLRLPAGTPAPGAHPPMLSAHSAGGHDMAGEAPSTHQDPAHPAGHLAHCLFCLTGAFALTPDPGPQPGEAAVAGEWSRAPAPRAPHAPPLPTRARAPPLSTHL